MVGGLSHTYNGVYAPARFKVVKRLTPQYYNIITDARQASRLANWTPADVQCTKMSRRPCISKDPLSSRPLAGQTFLSFPSFPFHGSFSILGLFCCLSTFVVCVLLMFFIFSLCLHSHKARLGLIQEFCPLRLLGLPYLPTACSESYSGIYIRTET